MDARLGRLGAVVVSSDYYAVLGVSPGAEDFVIRAAYRALIRHYHPDSNPDPHAQARARAITEAYTVLRDPAKRAEYDAGGKAPRHDDTWFFEERPRPPAYPQAPMRGVAMASVAVAILSVGLVWAWPNRIQPPPRTPVTETAKQTQKTARPVIELEPESERLARLGGMPSVFTPQVAPPPESSEPAVVEPPPAPMPSIETVTAAPVHRTEKAPKTQLAEARRPAAPAATPKTIPERPKPPPSRAAPDPGSTARIATLERISAGFYSQSMENADATKRQLLLSVRIRQTNKRGACRSDSCLADSYMRQIREIREIMENHASSSQ